MLLEKDLTTVLLLDTYGGLLTDKQQRLCDMYYNQDFSLAEIAQIERTTRQAVQDGIGKARHKLLEFEQRLGFSGIRQKSLAAIEQARAHADSPALEQLFNKLTTLWENDDGL